MNGCTPLLPEREFLIINIVYSGVSLLSLIMVVPSVVYGVFFCCKRGAGPSAERSDGLFLLIGLVVSGYLATNSFQWVHLFGRQSPYTVACTMIGTLYVYTMCALANVILCASCHLLLLIRPPKCLKVIAEVRIRRLRQVQAFYFIFTGLLPLADIPVKFLIDAKYGNRSGRGCMINLQCKEQFNWLLEPIIVLSASMVMWIFEIVVIVITAVSLCLYSKKLGNVHLYALLCLSLCYVVGFAIGGAFSISDASSKQSVNFAIELTTAIGIPFSNFMAGVVLMARMYYIHAVSRRSKMPSTSRTCEGYFRTCPVSEATPLTYSSSHTHYKPQSED